MMALWGLLKMGHNDEGYFDEDTGGAFSGMSLLTVVLPFAATIASLLFGILIGGVAGYVIKPSKAPIEYMKTASLAELQLVCEPVVEEQKTQLTRVKEQIGSLKNQVAAKEAEVAALRKEAANRKSGKASGNSTTQKRVAALSQGQLDRELGRAREELAEAVAQVKLLSQVKDQLVDQLTRAQQRLVKTEADLQAQVAITEALRDDSVELKDDVIVQRWFRMITEAQLDICEKGGKKKTEACREAVVGEITLVKREFVHCFRSNQATPAVLELQRGHALPHFARMLDQDNKLLQGWYLQMCDPTLPERDLPDGAAGIF